MDLQNAFNIIVNTVAIAPLTKQERISVEEALAVVVTELNEYDKLKKSMKTQSEAKKKRVEGKPDEKK